jgi:alpha-tubulin suppressor-like RCC1 family protein
MGPDFVLARTKQGIFGWGSNVFGALGLGDAAMGTTVRTPTLVTKSNWTGMDGGYRHACLFDFDNRDLLCAGDNQSSRLGLSGPARGNFTPLGMQLGGISAGYDRTCALQDAWRLVCWGSNIPATFEGLPAEIPAPTPVGERTDWLSISVGFDHLCGVTISGHLFCSGDNSEGELGRPGPGSAELIEPLPSMTFMTVSAGRNFTCATQVEDRKVICWGSNEHGKLGRGSELDQPGPPAYVCLPP